MPKLTKDPQGHPNLYLNEKGIWVLRKYVTGKREKYITLKTDNRYLAIQRCNQELARWLGSKGRSTKGKVFFEHVYYEVLELYQMKARATFENFETIGRLHLLPSFSGIPIDEVGKNWMRHKARSKRLNPKRKLQHDRRHLNFILRYAYDQELLDRVPKLELEASDRNPAQGREYTNSEINRMLSDANPKLRLKLEMQLKMGMRSGEVRLLKWEYIDFDRGFITLPAEVCKTRYERTYPVDPAVLSELTKLNLAATSEWVFPNRIDQSRPESRTDKTWQRLKRRVGVTGKQHWFRHTAVSRFIKSGIQPLVAQKAVGMSDQVMKRVYFHINERDISRMATVVSTSLMEHSE